jgi:DNA-binding XRE family transcriptional regulator
MDALEELFGLDPNSPETLRADFLVEGDMRMLDALVEIRKSRSLSQREVGRIMGISQPSVAQFEAHDSNPRLSTIRRYAMAIGALIRHEVVADGGQLSDGRWQRIDIVVPSIIMHMPAGPMTVVTDSGDLRSPGAAPFRYVENGCTGRTDFALAA